MSQNTDIQITQERRVALPITYLLIVLSSVAVGYAAWASTSARVEQHEIKINALEVDQRTTREILIRIDENVKELRSQRHP